MNNVLYVEQNQDGTVGGSYWCLYYILKNMDTSYVNPSVMFYQDHSLLSMFKDIGIATTIYEKKLGKKIFHKYGLLGKAFKYVYNVVQTDLVPVWHFIRFIRKNSIDLVHLNNTCQGGLSWNIACRICGIPCITHQRIYPSNLSFHELYNANKFSTIICITEDIKKDLEYKKISANKTVIYDALDAYEFCGRVSKPREKVRSEFEVLPEEKLIVLVGNFQEWKGQHIALKALKYITPVNSEIKIMFVGDFSTINYIGSDYYNEINSIIENYNLHDKVIITGYRNDVPDLMNAADLIIHTSITPEPFGMVIVEAMSLEKVVISTNIGGPAEIIENYMDGILIDPGKPELLASTILDALDDEEKMERMGRMAAKKVSEKFSIELQIKYLLELYRKLLTY